MNIGTTIILIYLVSVLMTRWAMVRRMRKRKSYYNHWFWLVPLANIIGTITVLSDDVPLAKSKLYKWWIGENHN